MSFGVSSTSRGGGAGYGGTWMGSVCGDAIKDTGGAEGTCGTRGSWGTENGGEKCDVFI